METVYNNSPAARGAILNAGLAAFGKHTAGSAYWTAKVVSTERVAGEGTKRDFWSYEDLLQLGLVNPESRLSFCQ